MIKKQISSKKTNRKKENIKKYINRKSFSIFR